MEEQNKINELFKIMGLVDKGDSEVGQKHLRHKPYQNDFGGKDYDE